MIKNRTKVTIKGLNQERIINKLIKKVGIYNLKRKQHGISQFEVNYRDRKTIKNLLREDNVEIVCMSNFGVLHFLVGLLKSWGIMIGLAFCLLCFSLQYCFVLKIEVFGAEKGLKEEIIQFVEQNLTSRVKGQIEPNKLENLLRGEFEEISSVSAMLIGQSLVVSINQVEVPEEMNDEFKPICSEYDGRIININLVQGTLAVNEGDIVKKGDILVYPYVYDSQGIQIPSQPKAEIKADVWLEVKETHYDTRLQTRRTGNRIEINEVYFMVHSNLPFLIDQRGDHQAVRR